MIFRIFNKKKCQCTSITKKPRR
ncbi:hypothetical protein EI200_24325 [Peribacillus simplex]|nr:hypothetical protein EI200_24325 [Peribacillus simplex]